MQPTPGGRHLWAAFGTRDARNVARAAAPPSATNRELCCRTRVAQVLRPLLGMRAIDGALGPCAPPLPHPPRGALVVRSGIDFEVVADPCSGRIPTTTRIIRPRTSPRRRYR